jgi:hypothetical protein
MAKGFGELGEAAHKSAADAEDMNVHNRLLFDKQRFVPRGTTLSDLE